MECYFFVAHLQDSSLMSYRHRDFYVLMWATSVAQVLRMICDRFGHLTIKAIEPKSYRAVVRIFNYLELREHIVGLYAYDSRSMSLCLFKPAVVSWWKSFPRQFF